MHPTRGQKLAPAIFVAETHHRDLRGGHWVAFLIQHLAADNAVRREHQYQIPHILTRGDIQGWGGRRGRANAVTPPDETRFFGSQQITAGRNGLEQKPAIVIRALGETWRWLSILRRRRL